MAVNPTRKKVSSVPAGSAAKFVYGSYPPSAQMNQRIKPSKQGERDYGKGDDMPPVPFGNTSMTGRS